MRHHAGMSAGAPGSRAISSKTRAGSRRSRRVFSSSTSSPQPRSPAAGADGPKAGTGPLRSATFEITNEVKVTVPDGARQIRVWMAMPQDDDPAQQVTRLKIDAPGAYRFTRDSEGSRVLYFEVS